MRKRVILSCEGEPYLTRWTLFRLGPFALFLHKFHISDEVRALHDHPWSFLSLILWRGYYEHTPKGKKRIYPGMILWRPAEWLHRVELLECSDSHPEHFLPRGLPAWTLVLHLRRRRTWGFDEPGEGWIPWRQWHKSKGCVDQDD